MSWNIVYIIVGILVFAIIIKLIISSKKNNTDNDAIINEIIYYIESVKKLYNGSGRIHISKDTFCNLIIVPLNGNGEYFASNSDRVQLFITLFDDCFFDNSFKIQYLETVVECNSSPFMASFHKGITMGGNRGFVAVTCQSFRGSYKSFMHSLYNKINNVFPNRFMIISSDGRIISANNYPNEIFEIVE